MNCVLLIIFHVTLLRNVCSTLYNYENYDYYDNIPEEVNNDSEPLLITTPKVIMVSIGETVLLPCEVNSSDHILRLWKKGRYLIYQDNIKLTELTVDNINILKNATLEVKVESEEDINEYTCQVISMAGVSNVTHRILLKYDATSEETKLTSLPELFEVIVGETVSLPCEVSKPSSHETNHTVRVWKKGEINLLYKDNFKISTLENINILPQGTLQVKTESASDTNTYTCEIVSVKLVQRVSYKLIVLPKLSTASKKFEVNFGETIVLPCDVYYDNILFSVSIDQIIRTWSRSNLLLYHGKDKYAGTNVNLLHNGSLQIAIDSSDDLGEYSCSIVSAGGKIKEITHTVAAKNQILPKLITKPQVFTTNVGETILLPCEISYPYDDVVRYWIRVNSPHSGKFMIHSDNGKYSNGTLKVKIKKDDNLAEYRCIIKTSGKSKIQRITHRISLISSSARHAISSILILALYLLTYFL